MVVAGAFLWLLVGGIGFANLSAAFARLSWPAVLAALALTALAHAVRVLRWWRLLRVLEPSLRPAACVRPFLCGFAINAVVPFRVGDAFRALAFQEELRSPAMRVFGTLVIERGVDTVAMCGLFFVGLLALPVGAVPRGVVLAVAVLAAVGFVGLLVVVVALPWVVALLRRAPSDRGGRAGRWAARQGLHLVGALRLVRSAPRMAMLGVLTVVIWALEGVAFVVVAVALGVGEPWPGPWFALALGTLSTSLPLAPGHVGTFDYLTAQGFVAFGAALPAAVACALTVHALWVPFTVAGLVLYWVRGDAAGGGGLLGAPIGVRLGVRARPGRPPPCRPR